MKWWKQISGPGRALILALYSLLILFFLALLITNNVLEKGAQGSVEVDHVAVIAVAPENSVTAG